MRLVSAVLIGSVSLSAGYIAPLRNKPVSTRRVSTRVFGSLASDEACVSDPARLSARDARIVRPLSALMGLLISPYAASGAEAAAAVDPFTKSATRFMPGSLPNSVIVSRVTRLLSTRGFTTSNTLLGSSLCSDEINDTPESLITQLQGKLVNKQSGGVFNLGGLAGVPFVGQSGMGAFVSHCPDQGKIFILYGPHVGISNDEGKVGKVERLGREGISGSCGATLGAFKAIAGGASSTGAKIMDFQEDYIIRKLEARLGDLATELSGGDATIAYVTKQMVEVIDNLMMQEVKEMVSKAGFWDKVTEIVLLGGIVVNRGHGASVPGGEDMFKPMLMRSLSAEGEEDVFTETFGSFSKSLNEYIV